MKSDPAAPRVEQECPNCGLAHSDGRKCATLDPPEDGRREFEEWCRKKIGDIPANPWIWEAWTARAARERELETVLRKLANEASGFLSMASIGNHGVTNIRVMERRIAEARAALSETQPEPQEKL